MPVYSNYRQFGGVHPETAAAANMLAAAGVIAPHSGEPFSEELLFGIGGGLGCGYRLRRSRDRQFVGITLGFHNRWNLPTNYLVNLCSRLGAPITLHETLGRRTAVSSLNAAIKSQAPVMAWVDRARLPYQGLSPEEGGSSQHVVAVCGWEPESEEVLIDDLAPTPFRAAFDRFNEARARPAASKNRLLRIEAPPVVDLKNAVREGLRDCILQLAAKSRSTALPAIKVWARRMTDPSDPLGWPVIFRERLGLYSTLRAVFEAIVLDGSDGAGLRNLYASFLREAAEILDEGKLVDTAILYETTAQRWSELAAAVLPEEVPEFNETRALLFKRYAALKQGETGEMEASGGRLSELKSNLDREFPLGEGAIQGLFHNIQEKILAVYRGEYEALVMLRSALIS